MLTYMDILEFSSNMYFCFSAQKFHERHSETFQDERQKSIVRLLKKLETKSDVITNKDIVEFRLESVFSHSFM